MKTLLFLDCETSDLHPGANGEYFGELLEICIIVDTGNGATPIENIWRLEPKYSSQHNPKAMQVNRYHERKKDYVGLRPYHDVLKEIHTNLNKPGVIVVGHNVPFDIRHLNFWFEICGLDKINPRIIDTVQLAFEHLMPCGLKSLSMDSIKAFMGYDLPAHDALNDARACRQLYYELLRSSKARRFYWSVRNVYNQIRNMLNNK